MTSQTAWWRKWHRWIAFPTGAFVLFAAVTGFLTAFTEFFGEEEAIRERTRDMVSPVTVASPATVWSEPLSRALTAAGALSPGAPVDKVTIEFKGDAPRIMVFTGQPGGGEGRKLVFDAKDATLRSNEAYTDKPLLYRVHSGEFFGDGGLVVAMAWGLALVAITVSGLAMYLRVLMRVRLHQPPPQGIRRWFW
jgi:uncharacterized iron-regulated membrane protein